MGFEGGRNYIKSVLKFYDGEVTKEDIIKLFSGLDKENLDFVNRFGKRFVSKMLGEDKIQIDNIVVHDLVYHSDDIFATTIVQMLFPEAKIIRTRYENLIKKYQNDPNSVVLDVGKVYDVMRGCFDHHQYGKGKDAVKSESGITRASVGLIWDLVGKDIVKKTLENDEICKKMIDTMDETNGVPRDVFLNTDFFQSLANFVDKKLITFLDAEDTGELNYIRTNMKEVNPYTIVDFMKQNLWPVGDFRQEFMDSVGEGSFANEVILRVIRSGLSMVATEKNILQNNMPEKKLDGKLLVFKKSGFQLQKFALNYFPDAEFILYPLKDGFWMIKIMPKFNGVRNSYKFHAGIPRFTQEDLQFFNIEAVYSGRMIKILSEKDGIKLLESLYATQDQ